MEDCRGASTVWLRSLLALDGLSLLAVRNQTGGTKRRLTGEDFDSVTREHRERVQTNILFSLLSLCRLTFYVIRLPHGSGPSGRGPQPRLSSSIAPMLLHAPYQ